MYSLKGFILYLGPFLLAYLGQKQNPGWGEGFMGTVVTMGMAFFQVGLTFLGLYVGACFTMHFLAKWGEIEELPEGRANPLAAGATLGVLYALLIFNLVFGARYFEDRAEKRNPFPARE